MMPVLAGTKLANARKIETAPLDRTGQGGKPIWAIDADGELYEFRNAATVERETRITASRIQTAIGDWKKGRREVPLVEGFVWCYCADKEQLQKLKAWIALNAADNRQTHI